MKILQVNRSDITGGATPAAYRIQLELQAAGIAKVCRFLPPLLINLDERRYEKIHKGLAKIRPTQDNCVFNSVFKTGNPIIHFLSFFPSNWME